VRTHGKRIVLGTQFAGEFVGTTTASWREWNKGGCHEPGRSSGLSSPPLVPVRKFLSIFCRTGSAHTTEDARKVLLALEPAGHRHIQDATLGDTQHLLRTLYPAV